MATPADTRRHSTWVTALILLMLAFAAPVVLVIGVIGVGMAFAYVGELPRELPNGHRIVTVNRDWHSIGYPGGNSLVMLDAAVPGAFVGVIGTLGVHDDLVFGTVRDGGARSIAADGYFIFDTRSGAAETFTSLQRQQWLDRLQARAVPVPPRLESPRARPIIW